jgi:hypothetical protein
MDINFGIIECMLFGIFIFGSYLKKRMDDHIRNKAIQDVVKNGIHLSVAVYTIYRLYENKTFNGNLLQESNKMFAHYNKNFLDMVNLVKTSLDEMKDNNEKFVEMAKAISKINTQSTEENNVERNNMPYDDDNINEVVNNLNHHL